MSHKLWRLREKLCNTPLLVNRETYESVVSYLDARNSDEVEIRTPEASSGDSSNSERRRFLYNPDTQTAVMYFEGPTTYRPITFFGMDCGGANYTSLKEDIEFAIEDGAKTIALMVDSGGGEAHGMIDSARYIRAILDEHDVQMIAYVDGMAASAAYGISSVADEIIASSDSELGSIGVLVQLINNSEALKMNGFERTFITAGDDKIPYADDGSWREGFLEDLQAKVDSLYINFTQHVADMRNLPVETVRATKANTFLAKDAVELGLADKVMTPEEFYTYLADKAQLKMENKPVGLKDRIFNFSRTQEDDPVKLAELQTQLEAIQAELETVQVSLKASVDENATLTASIADMVAENEKLAEALAAREEAVALLETELADFKAETVVNARRTRLAAIMPADKVDGVLEKFASLDDSAFEAAAEGYALAYEAMKNSEAMQELGADADEEVDETPNAQAGGDDATRAAIARLTKRK